jgi:hypothetical protein
LRIAAIKRNPEGDITLAWFAKKSGNKAFFEKERFLMNPEEMGKLSRLGGAGLVWLSQYEAQEGQNIPSAWKGEGANPIVIFTGEGRETSINITSEARVVAAW